MSIGGMAACAGLELLLFAFFTSGDKIVVVYIHLDGLSGCKPMVALCSFVANFNALNPDVFLRKRRRECGYRFGYKPVKPLPRIVCPDYEFFHYITLSDREYNPEVGWSMCRIFIVIIGISYIFCQAGPENLYIPQ